MKYILIACAAFAAVSLPSFAEETTPTEVSTEGTPTFAYRTVVAPGTVCVSRDATTRIDIAAYYVRQDNPDVGEDVLEVLVEEAVSRKITELTTSGDCQREESVPS